MAVSWYINESRSSLDKGACHREQSVYIRSVSNRRTAVLLLRNDGTAATTFRFFSGWNIQREAL